MKMQKVKVRCFKASGKWYTDEDFEVPYQDYLHAVWESIKEHIMAKWSREAHIGWMFMIETPGHPHDHPYMFIYKATEAQQ